MNAYLQLEAHYRQLNALEGAMGLLHWDSETMMPSGSHDVRAEQLATLASIAHEKQTDARLADWFADCESDMAGLNAWQRANLREMQQRFIHATALDGALVTALTHATSMCEHIWKVARKNNDYVMFLPHFEEVIRLTREAAAAKADKLDVSPYDALLDQYDPGLRRADIDPLFARLRDFLPPLIARIIDKQSREDAPLPYPPLPVAQQEALGRSLMPLLGFDFTKGRMDSSAHPFCGGVPGDIRLTTRYDEQHFAESLYAVLHETGHALYEMGLPADYRSQPVGQARGMSLHESQSLFVEMQLCLRPSFLHFLEQHLHTQFGLSDACWGADNLYRTLTRVQPTLIRVTADECTYPLHVILRYELEQALLDGSLAPADLPGAWDEKMQHYLGIRPDNVANGCLQDTHWPGGAIGYFPTYSLGAMIAAQWMDAVEKALPSLDDLILQGEFQPIVQWLRQHVHSKGSFYSTMQMIKEATGQPLNAAIYEQHLTRRYLEE